MILIGADILERREARRERGEALAVRDQLRGVGAPQQGPGLVLGSLGQVAAEIARARVGPLAERARRLHVGVTPHQLVDRDLVQVRIIGSDRVGDGAPQCGEGGHEIGHLWTTLQTLLRILTR